MTNKDKQDLLDFAKDHIKHFGALPLEFETAGGELILYDEVWQVCEEAGVLALLPYK